MYKLQAAVCTNYTGAQGSSACTCPRFHRVLHACRSVLPTTARAERAAWLSAQNVQDSTSVLSMSFAVFCLLRNTRDIWHCTYVSWENRVVIRYATFRAPHLVNWYRIWYHCYRPREAAALWLPTQIYIYLHICETGACYINGGKKQGQRRGHEVMCVLGLAAQLARRM